MPLEVNFGGDLNFTQLASGVRVLDATYRAHFQCYRRTARPSCAKSGRTEGEASTALLADIARAVRTECRDAGGVKEPKQERAVPLAPAAPQGSRGVPRARPCRLRPCAAAASRSPDAEGQR